MARWPARGKVSNFSRDQLPKTNCSPIHPETIPFLPSRNILVAHITIMSLNISRAVFRQSTKLPGRTARRFESTSSKATEAAKDTASKASQTAAEYKSKASEGLTRVASSAGPAISSAAKGLGSALSKVGGRTGRFVAFVERECGPCGLN